jgi:uncharacterized protein
MNRRTVAGGSERELCHADAHLLACQHSYLLEKCPVKMFVRRLIVSCAFATTSLTAMAAPPTTESVETLLGLTQAEANLNRMFDQLAPAMRAGVLNALKTQALTASQESVVSKFTSTYVKSVKEQYGWAFVKPTIVQIYRETFTDEEVNGQIVFYRSPAGEAAIKKTPIVAQKSALATQSHVNSLTPKINEAMKTLVKEVQESK